MSDSFPQAFLNFLAQIKGKRSQIVVQHILKHGFITTEDLEATYGYKHPPRAIRDVREQGVPIESFRVKDSQNRDIAAYRFGDIQNINKTKFGGRKSFKKITKQQLIEKHGLKCAICNQHYPEQFLQIDHKIPYEIRGDIDNSDLDGLMLVCASCNRAKSWVCEHCPNWQYQKESTICQSCFWASPLAYQHIALQEIRRVEIIWQNDEITDYNWLKNRADEAGQPLTEYIKSLIIRLKNKIS
ncbi:MAG: HNH endonuclease [Anaerolineae bacterium]|jgi:5-methylcytosine-specific restriction endonuclease McrA|nr:HNH endonuclease [Anaerolineae bacterium]